MANISGTYYSSSSYYPKFTYTISYSEIGRNASSVSYRFNVSYSRSNNWYGYDIQVNWNINGTTGSKEILAANVNAASGSITFDVTTATNAAGGTLSARIYTTSNTDSTHWQNAIDTGTQTVNKSTFNTPPSLSGTVSTSPSGTFSEKATSVTVSWPAATDSNSNLSGYRIRVSINGGGYTELTRTTGLSYAHNISGYGEGTSFRYAIDAYDAYSEWSATIYSATIAKNVFNNDTLASTDSIIFTTPSINFTYSGGSNTQSGVTISRTLSCSDSITVYNPTGLTSPATVGIYKGNTLSGPYIKFDDLKTRFANTTDKGKGTITFTLTSTNSNGTVKTSTKSISVNLQANPNAVTNAAISLVQTESTNYLSLASTTNKYFIPDGTKVTRVKWSTTTGALGEAVKYKIYVAYGTGGWNWLADLATGSTYYNHAVPTQTASQQFKYLIQSVSVYSDSLTTDMPTTAQILHYYNQVGLTEGTKTRQSITCEVKITVNTVSSIPNINTTGSWKAYKQGTITPIISSGTLSITQLEQTFTVTGLTENEKYDLVVTYNDNTGLTTTNKTATINIGPFTPVFHINKYGIGVGGAIASSSQNLNVNGAADISIADNSAANNLRNFVATKATVAGGTGSPGQYHLIQNFGIGNAAAQLGWYYGGTNILKFRAMNANNSTWGEWGNIYSSLNKPTPADIGASASGHTHSYLPLSGGTLTGSLYIGDGVSGASANGSVYSRIVRSSSDGASSLKVQFGTGASASFEVLNAAWTKSLFSVNTSGTTTINGSEVVAKGDGSTGWYVRLYDGTQICVGWYSWGNINMFTDIASSNIFGDTAQATNGRGISFPATFVNAPYVIANTQSNGYINTHVSSASTTNCVVRIWTNYYSAQTGIKTEYIAIGRWK